MTIAALLMNTYKACSPPSPEGGNKKDYGEDGELNIVR
jgi:hypothetical protein